MNLTRDRVRSIGWAFVLTVCFAMTMALTLRVNAVKSQVRLAERQIVQLKRENLFLETEFEARANQQQLKALNDVEFGYSAPSARQYIEGERQLVAFGKPRAPGAPEPIRVAALAPAQEGGGLPAMVSPLTGKAMAAEVAGQSRRKPTGAVGLGERLARIDSGDAHAQAGEARAE